MQPDPRAEQPPFRGRFISPGTVGTAARERFLRSG